MFANVLDKIFHSIVLRLLVEKLYTSLNNSRMFLELFKLFRNFLHCHNLFF